MKLRRAAAAAACLTALAMPAAASAADPCHRGAIKNIEYVKNLPRPAGDGDQFPEGKFDRSARATSSSSPAASA